MSNKDDPIILPDDPIIPAVGSTPSAGALQDESESSAVTVDTESTITPISKEEIPQIDALDWPNMTVGELYDQLNSLEQRKYYCQTYAPLIVNDIERGLTRLRLIIDKKQGNEVKLI